ncbi:hypothetical protein MH117_18530 [Paenibacillus sp. ACRRX]|uniref:hypothetical protein n=1 Tax=Paenibacillus sp. ACRRX TaxID=2918206 RepID=UPI001EF5856B|nr:hypothetical protein [Paenibacillus sp. ACRRX]MCG7409409.1 hypothetical protein [Paenibacillus sp. ACRRX]
MHVRKNTFIFILVFFSLMTTLLGCSNHNAQSRDENNNEILGLTNEIRKITSSHLAKITKDMTYREMINTLGNTKDIGSGIKIFRYEYENGQFLDINIFEHNHDVKIREDVYKHIQYFLHNKKP